MARLTAVLSGLLLLAGAVHADNLLTNGDFEQPLETGWTQDVDNLAGEYRFERSDTFGQPDPGYAAKAYKYLAYHASLTQTVDVPGVDLSLTFNGRLIISGGSSTCWPVATVIVSYLDETDSTLGRTLIILRDEYCTWTESDSVHFIEVTLPGEWTQYRLDVADELSANLPAVAPADVRRVKLELFAYDNGT